MAEVVWTTRALADPKALGAYQALFAPSYAEVLSRKLMRAVERLESFPASGRVVPEIEDESLREVIHRNYRIVYIIVPDEDKLEVLTVFHSSRQFGALPGKSAE